MQVLKLVRFANTFYQNGSGRSPKRSHQRSTISVWQSSLGTDRWHCYGVPSRALSSKRLMSSIKDTLERQGKLPSFYHRYVDETLTVMPNLATATSQHTLNSVHTSFKFTMEVEKNGKLPFLGTELLNHAPLIETKVYVKPTNTGLLLHYQSHVDNRYKQSILTTMLDRTHQLSSSWAYFSEECDHLKKVFAHLKYLECLVNSTIKTFLQSRIVDKQPSQTPKEPRAIVRVVIPFKDQESANYVKKELKNLSIKVQTTVQPVFVSRKIGQDLKVLEQSHRSSTNASFIVFNVTCVMQVTWAIRGDTCTHMWMDIN